MLNGYTGEDAATLWILDYLEEIQPAPNGDTMREVYARHASNLRSSRKNPWDHQTDPEPIPTPSGVSRPGPRALDQTNRWFAHNGRTVAIVASAAAGAYLAIKGLIALTS